MGGPWAVGPTHQRQPQPRRQVRRVRAGRRAGPLARRRDPGKLSRSPEASPAKASFRLRDLPGFEHERTIRPTCRCTWRSGCSPSSPTGSTTATSIRAVLWVLDIHARGLLDVCGGCEKIRNTPLSPSYKGLLRTGLALNVLVAPWLIVPENGLWSLPVVPAGVLLSLRRRIDRFHRRGAVRPGPR